MLVSDAWLTGTMVVPKSADQLQGMFPLGKGCSILPWPPLNLIFILVSTKVTVAVSSSTFTVAWSLKLIAVRLDVLIGPHPHPCNPWVWSVWSCSALGPMAGFSVNSLTKAVQTRPQIGYSGKQDPTRIHCLNPDCPPEPPRALQGGAHSKKSLSAAPRPVRVVWQWL